MDCQSLVGAEGGGRGCGKEGGAGGLGAVAGGRDVWGGGGGLASAGGGMPLEDLEMGIVDEDGIAAANGLELVELIAELGDVREEVTLDYLLNRGHVGVLFEDGGVALPRFFGDWEAKIREERMGGSAAAVMGTVVGGNLLDGGSAMVSRA